jgi:hypothetical protein
MNSESWLVIVVAVLILVTLGEPDLLDVIIERLQCNEGGITNE